MEFENKVVLFELKLKQEEINGLFKEIDGLLKKKKNIIIEYAPILLNILEVHMTDVNSYDWSKKEESKSTETTERSKE